MPQYDWAKMAPREPVAWFAEHMEETLRRNDHKGGWDDCSTRWLLSRLHEELDELAESMSGRCGCREADCPHVLLTPWDMANKDRVIQEATDVANFAMMIADKARHAALRAKGVDV
ncbi:hypothetical protein [Alicyclobacillus dauci]|uniref:MazG nucleotide pyrophosphohydrolase domain-containing protein n=1 Tax=Alicyclobacillus dauci TaxID=1475485 RepID=A0ABY6Z7U2_9BACL|nr:hypothetical protein [Alicyclobacillus dauci]WAH38598.1 hypothetical protein NZD86_09000 [Alicyclobacillus dauci]